MKGILIDRMAAIYTFDATPYGSSGARVVSRARVRFKAYPTGYGAGEGIDRSSAIYTFVASPHDSTIELVVSYLGLHSLSTLHQQLERVKGIELKRFFESLSAIMALPEGYAIAWAVSQARVRLLHTRLGMERVRNLN